MRYISYWTSLVCVLSWHQALCCVDFMIKCPYRVPSSPSFFPDVKWREVSQSATDTPSKQANADWHPEGSSCPNKLMWVMRGICSCSRFGLFLSMSEIKVRYWGKLILLQGLQIFTGMLSPVVKKKEAEKMSWVSDSRVCVYFVLVGCQPLHAWFPKGLRVFTATWLETYRGTDKVWQRASKDYSGTRWRSCFCLSHHRSPLWPRYFCSLKSLAKLGPCYSCTSKLRQNLGKKIQCWGFLPDISLYWSLVFPLMCKILLCFAARLSLLSHCIFPSTSFLRSFCCTSPCLFIHLPPFQPLIFSPPAH